MIWLPWYEGADIHERVTRKEAGTDTAWEGSHQQQTHLWRAIPILEDETLTVHLLFSLKRGEDNQRQTSE